MDGKRKCCKVLLTVAAAMFIWSVASVDTHAETAGLILASENIGASIVLDTNAYNDADTRRIGIVIEEEEEVDSVDLVMCNVRSVLNVRAEANTEATILGKMYRDCGGKVIEKGEEWSLIESGDLVGYASNEYLLFGDEAVEMAKNVGTMTAIVSGGNAYIRAAADENANFLGFAAPNTLLEVIEELDDEWILVGYGDFDGYLKSECVKLEFNIDHGETMEAIKERKRKEQEEKNKLKRQNDAIAADDDTLRLLASLIYCEARGESYEGMLAVGSVVMNRVRSRAYPDSVYDVIFASGQFTPAMSGSLQKAYVRGANAICTQAAQEVLNGYSNVGEMTHFRRKGSKEGYIIGNHVFY